MRGKRTTVSVKVLAACLVFGGGSAWAAVFNPDGATHDPTKQSGWALPTAPGTGLDNCLFCHKPGGIAPDKSSYLLGGHKNMSRLADGMQWGMPGVDSTHPARAELSTSAGLNSDGSFPELWIQEDYPRMPVNWTTGTGAALSSVTTGYCAKDGSGAISTDDVPDLAACPDCESPVMGNGNAGYPLNYPSQAICEAAKKPSTGAPGYVWIAATTQPLYWIYGGAGLEGGPAMMEPGSQPYKCGRCHTTGWTANHAADDISTKHPASDFPTVDFKTLTAVGTGTLLLRPSTAGDSATDVSSWDQWGIQCSRCHVATDGGHATWPTSSTTGGDIVAVCMTCHRMESDTAPRANANQNGYTANTDAATVFTNKQQQPDGFAHHPDGPEFLNSPHAKFTGPWGQIGCPPYAINGYGSSITPYAPGAPTECTPGTMNLDGSASSSYGSKFAQAAKVDLTGISDSVAGSCETCHDVHKPLNENTAGMSTSVRVGCTDCHSSSKATVSPQVNLINHPNGPGTPLKNVAADPSSACRICHQPPGIRHIWRINTDASYSTYGDYTSAYPVNGSSAAAAAKNVNLSNTAPDGLYSNAVWIDLDNACGQCHGGGVSETDVTTTGLVTAGSTDGTSVNVLTVADATGFASGKEVTIAGAGVAGADFKTIIAKVSGTTVYLTYPAVTTVSEAMVTVAGNPTANGAPYMTKAQLAGYATGIHSNACVGDCSGDGVVTVGEILTMVDIALGNAGLSSCQAGDQSGDRQITVDEILTAVDHALNGC